MQQAKGSTEIVNYTGTKSPSKLEQNWGQGQGNYKGTKTPPMSKQNLGQDLSNCQRKSDTVSIVQVLHTLAPYAQLQISDALGRAVGE